MEIIKQNDFSNWNHICDCFRCDSTLKVKEEDLFIKRKVVHQYGGDMQDFFHAKCIVCDYELFIPEDKLHAIIKYRVKKTNSKLGRASKINDTSSNF